LTNASSPFASAGVNGAVFSSFLAQMVASVSSLWLAVLPDFFPQGASFRVSVHAFVVFAKAWVSRVIA